MAETGSIEPDDLPVEVGEEATAGGKLKFELPMEGLSIEDLERDLIIKAMERSGWVIAKAAPLLGMSYKTLQYRLEKFGIRH